MRSLSLTQRRSRQRRPSGRGLHRPGLVSQTRQFLFGLGAVHNPLPINGSLGVNRSYLSLKPLAACSPPQCCLPLGFGLPGLPLTKSSQFRLFLHGISFKDAKIGFMKIQRCINLKCGRAFQANVYKPNFNGAFTRGVVHCPLCGCKWPAPDPESVVSTHALATWEEKLWLDEPGPADGANMPRPAA
ncbi:MAG: hypothetical protein JWR21_3289 [Herminiimonas sp.]|nr:hypothetical protein [Herminiimonas sp.]